VTQTEADWQTLIAIGVNLLKARPQTLGTNKVAGAERNSNKSTSGEIDEDVPQPPPFLSAPMTNRRVTPAQRNPSLQSEMTQ